VPIFHASGVRVAARHEQAYGTSTSSMSWSGGRFRYACPVPGRPDPSRGSLIRYPRLKDRRAYGGGLAAGGWGAFEFPAGGFGSVRAMPGAPPKIKCKRFARSDYLKAPSAASIRWHWGPHLKRGRPKWFRARTAVMVSPRITARCRIEIRANMCPISCRLDIFPSRQDQIFNWRNANKLLSIPPGLSALRRQLGRRNVFYEPDKGQIHGTGSTNPYKSTRGSRGDPDGSPSLSPGRPAQSRARSPSFSTISALRFRLM